VLQRADSLIAERRYPEALGVLGEVSLPAVPAPDLALRILLAESWARMSVGELGAADALLERARTLAEGAVFTDADRAEAIFRLACCRLKLGDVSDAVELFAAAVGAAAPGGQTSAYRCAAGVLQDFASGSDTTRKGGY
jgi:hypothetical protein